MAGVARVVARQDANPPSAPRFWDMRMMRHAPGEFAFGKNSCSPLIL